jgi:alpha-amylase
LTLVTLLFVAHQPYRLRPYEQRRPGASGISPVDAYFDAERDRAAFCHAAESCYYPATRMLLDLLRAEAETSKPFKVAFGLTGAFLEQAERHEPDLIVLFQHLAETGRVEFTGETYFHSLASLYEGDRQEFREQVHLHGDTIERLFGQRPTVFRNTECLYNNTVADTVLHLGFDGIITEGVDWLMEGWRSPDYIYEAPSGLPVLLRNYRLSEDITLRFADRKWEHWPLDAPTYAGWLAQNTAMNVLISMNYETLGVHLPAETGILEFFRALPAAIRQHPQLEFSTPSEAISRLPRQGNLLVNDFATISWADRERDTTAWLGNPMQQFVYEELKRMEIEVRSARRPDLLRFWRQLQGSEHLRYLSNKAFARQRVPAYFRAYGNIFEAFVSLQTALSDLQRLVRQSDADRSTT